MSVLLYVYMYLCAALFSQPQQPVFWLNACALPTPTCHSLIPIGHEEWPDVNDELLPGVEVTVRVKAIRQLGLYRWPVQLELVDEVLAPLITRPDEWDAPINLEWAFDQGWTMEQIMEATGRTYTSAK